MIQRIPSTSLFVAFAALAAPSHAADIEFKEGLITESRTFEKEELVRGGTPEHPVRPVLVSINRVTVALDGELITGDLAESARITVRCSLNP